MEGADRIAWQKPDAVVAQLATMFPAGASPVIAELGASTGLFAIRVARAMPNARVIALERERPMVDFLAKRAQEMGIPNLRAQFAMGAQPSEPVDLLFMVVVYHHITEDRAAALADCRRALKPGGRVVILDLIPGVPVPGGMGPPESMKVPEQTVLEEMRAAGFELVSRHPGIVDVEYFLVFKSA